MSGKPVALIAGVTSGIGEVVARLLGEHGMAIFIGSRDEVSGHGLVGSLVAQQIDARFVHLDATDPASLAAATRWIGNTSGGHLDVLINNASTVLDRSLPSPQAARTFKDAFEANVLGPLSISRAMLPLLRQSPAGRIVNVTSGLNSLAPENDPDWEFAPYKVLCYNCSRAALGMQTVLLADELARDNESIKVNAIHCGRTAPDLFDHTDPTVIERSAHAIMRLATLPAQGVSGSVSSEDNPMS